MELTSAGPKPRRRHAIVFVGFFSIVGTLTGCDEGFPVPVLSQSGQTPVLTVLSSEEPLLAVDETLPEPLVVRAATEAGQPIWGQNIEFEVVAGGGSVSVEEATTNQSGLAQSEWTLGPDEGWQEVEIRANANDDSRSVMAVYRARALPKGPYSVHVSTSSLELADPGDSAQLTAEVRGETDEPIEDISVSWTSTDEAVATVSTDGVAKAVEIGEAYVIAKFRKAADSVHVQVGTDEEPSGGGSGADSDAGSGDVVAAECANADSAWIWCDDFEEDRLSEYFEYSNGGGSFQRDNGVGVGGSHGMRTRFQSGQVSAGSLKMAFGQTPASYFRAVDAGTGKYRDIYWRVYVRYADDWVGGGGDKMSRVTVLARSDWSQAMIGHVWSGRGSNEDYLMIDPASGTSTDGSLITSGYNDFNNLRWLGARRGDTPLFGSNGEWHCVEARVRLNDAGSSNGAFELWIDGELDARISNMNWLGRYSDYGMNAVFLENYWNAGSPRTQERYFDRFVVSTERIGC